MKWLSFIMALIGPAVADLARADEPRPDRSIRKQPVYRLEAPTYALLEFGRAKSERVWLVRDGRTLYVDRNGNGDLTEQGERVEALESDGVSSGEDGYFFNVGRLVLGNRVHQGLTVSFDPLAQYFDSSLASRDDVAPVLKQNPRAFAITLEIDAEVDGVGGGTRGRPHFRIGPADLNGLLQFAPSPQTAPVIRIGAPLQVTFFSRRPVLMSGRTSDFILVVGSPGVGPGTFASISYEETIPESAYPLVALAYNRLPTGRSRQTERIKLRERC